MQPGPDRENCEANESRFLRHGLTRSGCFESICLQCGFTIARSPDMRDLQNAEEGHVCRASPKHL